MWVGGEVMWVGGVGHVGVRGEVMWVGGEVIYGVACD